MNATAATIDEADGVVEEAPIAPALPYRLPQQERAG